MKKERARSCNAYRKVKFLEHAIKIIERVLERIRELVNIDVIRLVFMPGRETTDELFVVRRMKEEYKDERKLCLYYVDIKNAFDRVPREMIEWATRKDDFTRSICESEDKSLLWVKNES